MVLRFKQLFAFKKDRYIIFSCYQYHLSFDHSLMLNPGDEWNATQRCLIRAMQMVSQYTTFDLQMV